MECKACKKDGKIKGHGLCLACYCRFKRRGTTDYAPVRQKNVCNVGGCGRFVVSYGLCDLHRARLKKHGDVSKGDEWGTREGHPLINSWRHLRRFRGIEKICESWRDDFLQFVADVGDRPSKKHKLFVADDSKPIGPDNFVWKESVTQRVEGEDDKTYRNRQQRVYRALKPEAFKGYDTKKSFGLSIQQFEKMHDAQNCSCAICGNPETYIINGKNIRLSVDHCHETGKIRGLLCGSCNKALGGFKDSPDLLLKAVEYLRKHTA